MLSGSLEASSSCLAWLSRHRSSSSFISSAVLSSRRPAVSKARPAASLRPTVSSRSARSVSRASRSAASNFPRASPSAFASAAVVARRASVTSETNAVRCASAAPRFAISSSSLVSTSARARSSSRIFPFFALIAPSSSAWRLDNASPSSVHSRISRVFASSSATRSPPPSSRAASARSEAISRRSSDVSASRAAAAEDAAERSCASRAARVARSVRSSVARASSSVVGTFVGPGVSSSSATELGHITVFLVTLSGPCSAVASTSPFRVTDKGGGDAGLSVSSVCSTTACSAFGSGSSDGGKDTSSSSVAAVVSSFHLSGASVF